MKGFDDVRGESAQGSKLHFTRKHVYSTQNNPICGITFYQWFCLLYLHGVYRYIDVCYLPRAAFVTAISLFNSLLALIEGFFYPSRIIDAVQLADDPVFIIGHPRTGTTLVHNFLSSDSENFFFCSTFCAGFPNCFLWFESLGKRLFSGVVQKTRPMDSMPLHFDLPQEDECATNVLSHGTSYYMPLWFMRQEHWFRRYLDFADEDGGTEHDERKWTASFLYLLKKLTLREQITMKKKTKSTTQRRLLIKSPIHAARIPLLRRLFKNATFVYLHRDPYEVLQSAAHMADTAYWFCYLNTPSDMQIEEFILWQFEAMWRKYNAAVEQPGSRGGGSSHRILSPDVLEVSYAQLVEEPIETLAEIYKHVGVQFDQAHFEKEVQSLKDYTPNKHVTLHENLQAIVQKRWAGYIEAFGY